MGQSGRDGARRGRIAWLGAALRAAETVGRAVLLVAGLQTVGTAQQVPDRSFRPPVGRPAFAAATGPRLCLDEGHHNFHTLDDRFWAFGELARRDGFRVQGLRATFDATALAACDLLVISNAQPSDQPWTAYPRPTPSAFTASEISAVRAWVEAGHALLLIADHMPLAGASSALAAAFGASFTDGFAYQAQLGADGTPTVERVRDVPTSFVLAEGTLRRHAVTAGRDTGERVTRIRSFTGQAFRWDAPDVEPVMLLPDGFVSLEPLIAWQFTPDTPMRPVGGWLQGATRRVGRGRVALFGEAAMFSAQVAGAERRPMGMNAPGAEQNARFVLNVLRWTSGVLDP